MQKILSDLHRNIVDVFNENGVQIMTPSYMGAMFTEPMGRMRGRKLFYEGIPVVPTWHPAYLLRTPSAKAQTWEDIKRVNRILGNPEVPSREDRQG